MPITPLRVLCLVGSLFTFMPTALAGEKDELALVIKQLEQLQASLERARVIAVQDDKSARFLFDYLRAVRDINTVRQGIEFYLEPSRAQPTRLSVSGQYRYEPKQ
ncbi:integrative conjugative element protein, RAQPRD family [Yersinia similis]|uniref:integrative conjugative element protein, RAQPRD family n=1 Tax=Yersinia similis TaxID=367190 RepID=UPI0011A026B0|nr:RAQPRD family integrative conjugative element protein [Yersinia similis]